MILGRFNRKLMLVLFRIGRAPLVPAEIDEGAAIIAPRLEFPIGKHT